MRDTNFGPGAQDQQQQQEAPDIVRPGRLLTTLHAMRQELELQLVSAGGRHRQGQCLTKVLTRPSPPPAQSSLVADSVGFTTSTPFRRCCRCFQVLTALPVLRRCSCCAGLRTFGWRHWLPWTGCSTAGLGVTLWLAAAAAAMMLGWTMSWSWQCMMTHWHRQQQQQQPIEGLLLVCCACCPASPAGLVGVLGPCDCACPIFIITEQKPAHFCSQVNATHPQHICICDLTALLLTEPHQLHPQLSTASVSAWNQEKKLGVEGLRLWQNPTDQVSCCPAAATTPALLTSAAANCKHISNMQCSRPRCIPTYQCLTGIVTL